MVRTIVDAAKIADYLLGQMYPDRCEALGLFGSVARKGEGNDVDLIVFVPLNFTARQFYAIGETLLRGIEVPTKADKQRIRQEAARRVLSIKRLAPDDFDEADVDVLLYPFYYSFEGAWEHLQRVAREYGKIEATIVSDLRLFIQDGHIFIPWPRN